MNVSRFFEKWIKIFLYVYVFQDFVLAYVCLSSLFLLCLQKGISKVQLCFFTWLPKGFQIEEIEKILYCKALGLGRIRIQVNKILETDPNNIVSELVF